MTVRRHVSNDFFAFQYFIVLLGLGVRGGGTFLCVALDYFVARRRLRDMINLFESIERGWFNRPVKEETMQANYKTMELALRNALNDLAILAGEKMGPSDASWQDVAGTCAVHLTVLAGQLNAARAGKAESFLVFPSPSECMEEVS